MAKEAKKIDRPRSDDSRVYRSDGAEIPYLRKDKVGNYYARWKDDKGVWLKKNLGRGRSKALLKYAKWEAEHKGETFSTLYKPNYLKSLSAKAEILLSENVCKLLEEKDIDLSFFLKNIVEKIMIEYVNAPEP